MASVTERLKKRALAAQTGSEREVLIALDKLRFDPTQPRKAYHPLDGRIAEKDLAYIDELAASIKVNGLIQPITVQELEDGNFLVVVGECRTRAHLSLGLSTIRATVRNDLTSPSRRLVYQIAENVNRQDLSDEELSLSIRLLLESGDEGKPMTQAAVAAQLGKSEGWVTRFVKFGDEELQRVWVRSGVADSVEKVYRLSILPKPVQMDILRRVELPEGDSERLEKPLNRNVIDDLSREAKTAKTREAVRDTEAKPKSMPGAPVEPVAAGSAAGSDEGKPGGRVIGDDAIDLAYQEELLAGQAGEKAGVAGKASEAPAASAPAASAPSVYVLDEAARLKLLSDATTDASMNPSMSSEDLKQSPVHCRVSVRNMEALLKLLAEDEDMLDSARGVRCDLIIPGGLAGLIANRLAGVMVDEQEVSAVVQSGLVKLG